MRLIHEHDEPGPGKVIVMAGGLPVVITVDPDAERRSVDIVTDDSKAAWSGPMGPRGHALGVEIGRPKLMDALRSKLGLREGSSISGGGSSVMSVHSAAASGGSVTGGAFGAGSRVTTGRHSGAAPESSVYLTVPVGCTFELRSHGGVRVVHDGSEMAAPIAQSRGLLRVVSR